MIHFGEFLTAHDNHAMLKPGTINLSRDYGADWFCKVNTNDFRTTGIRQRFDGEINHGQILAFFVQKFQPAEIVKLAGQLLT
jgi:hypothetical protein